MSSRKGKLYESVMLNLNDKYSQPNICDALNEARSQLVLVETMDQLNNWTVEWFGDQEDDR